VRRESLELEAPMDSRFGFIGLGQMGKWMALNLAKSGRQVTVFNRSKGPVQFLLKHGAIAGRSPADVAADSDIVLLCLPDTAVVEQMIFGPDGIADGARPGLIVVDASTISYMGTLDIARRLETRGIRFADAPISGMEARAKDGTLTIMVGADEELFATIEPALSAMGKTITHMGPVGSGQLTKLINQLLFNANMAAIAEVLPMAVKLGLDPEKVTQVVTTGTGRSFGLEFFAPRILEDHFTDGYPIGKAYKDMVSALEISASQAIPLPMTQAATTIFQMAMAAGLGSEDKGTLIKVFERVLDVQFRRGSAGK
jgi:3-hydroxyisobutyrate dehydrogenase-like beta-hydroxyacid dehydrogenase